MNKNVVIVVLLLSLISTVGFLVYDKTQSSGFSGVRHLSFDEPKHGLNMYNDLKSLGCEIYEGRLDGAMIKISSYNGFLYLTEDQTVFIQQSLSVYYFKGINRTHMQEYVNVFSVTELGIFRFDKSWQVKTEGNVTAQVLKERKIEW